MKSRFNFISNSSSTSFVILGLPLGEFDREVQEKLKDEYSSAFKTDKDPTFDLKDLIMLYIYNSDYLVGRIIVKVSSDSGGIESFEVSLEEINKFATDFKEKFNKTPRLIGGTIPS